MIKINLKGGESMTLTALGLVGTMISPQLQTHGSNARASGTSSQFGTIFATLTEDANVQVSGAKESTGTSLPVPLLEQLTDLLNFLQVDDLAEMKHGSQLIDEALSHSQSDIKQLLELAMNETEKATNGTIVQLFEQILSILPGEKRPFKLTNLQEMVAQLEKAHPPLASLLDGIFQKDELDKLGLQDVQQLIAFFAAVPVEQLAQVINHEFISIVKTGKLYELLMAYQDTYSNKDEQQLQRTVTEQLKQLAEKLQSLLNASKSASRHAYLQRTFTAVTDTEGHTQRFPGEAGMIQVALSHPEASSGRSKLDHVVGQPFHFQQVSHAEQFTLMIENSGKPVTPEQLIRQFQSILAKSQLVKADGMQKLFIKLHPEHLGALRIELMQRNGMMVARILTSTALARDMLDSQLHSLKQAFANQNIQVERLEISQQLSQQERFMNRENDGHQQGEQRHDEGREQKAHQDDVFAETFLDALLNVEV